MRCKSLYGSCNIAVLPLCGVSVVKWHKMYLKSINSQCILFFVLYLCCCFNCATVLLKNTEILQALCYFTLQDCFSFIYFHFVFFFCTIFIYCSPRSTCRYATYTFTHANICICMHTLVSATYFDNTLVFVFHSLAYERFCFARVYKFMRSTSLA